MVVAVARATHVSGILSPATRWMYVSYEQNGMLGDSWANHGYHERTTVSSGGMQASKRRTAAHASKGIRTRPTNNQLLYACRLGVHAILVVLVAARCWLWWGCNRCASRRDRGWWPAA